MNRSFEAFAKDPMAAHRRGAVAGMVVAAVAGLLLAGSALAGDAVDVQKAWQKHCQSCHGADGKGKTKAGEKSGAKDLASAEVKAAWPRAKMLEAIRDGVKEKDSDKMAMKGYAEKLTPAEIEALTDYSLAFK
jgi:mono/diheme cytochrome c family protein